MVSQVAGDLNAEIVQSCQTDYVPLISMDDPDTETNNPGTPGYYKYNVCVEGIEESSFSTSCEKNVGFYISSKNDTAHFSTQNSYEWHVCTGRMKTRVTTGSKFDNETALFSVSGTDNAHVAEPNFYDHNVYGAYETPDNVTLKLDFNLSSSDKVYFDNQKVNGEQSFQPPAEFPYIVAESSSYIAGIVSPEFLSAQRSMNSNNSLSLTRSGDSGFILPFTSGDRSDIEDQQQEILGKEFLNSVSPNFGFGEIETPMVKVRLDRDDISSGISYASGTYRINVTKTGKNQVSIEGYE